MTTCASGPCWTSTTLDPGFIGESAEVFNGLYIAGGSDPSTGNAIIQYSSDGIAWTRLDLGNFAGYGVRRLVTGNGLILGMLNAAQHILSSDGINWTAYNHFPPVSGDQGVAFVNGYFVFRASDDLAYSTDGINWSSTYSAGSGNYMNGINAAYGGGMYVTCGSAGFGYTTDVGIPITTVSNAPAAIVAYGNGAFVAFNRGLGASRDVYRSTNGITWTTYTAALPSTPGVGYYSWLLFEQDRFLACKEDSNELAYSTDGITWTLTTGDSLFDAGSGTGQFYMGSDNTGLYLAVNPFGTTAQVGVCPCVVPGDWWAKLSGVTLYGVEIGTVAPPPPAENYYWTATDGYTVNATLYDNGHYLTYSPFPGDIGNSIYVRSKAIIVGQRYCEFEVTAAATNAYVAFGVTEQSVDVFYNTGSGNIMTGSNGCGLAQQGTYNNGAATSSDSKYNFGVGDRIGIAFDATTKNMWISKNGTWLDGDPNTLSSPTMTVAVAGDLYFYNSHYTCFSPGTKTCYIYPDAAQQNYSAPTGFVPYAS